MDRPFALVAGTFIVALYGGYFGAGAGIVFLAVMGLLIPRPLGEVNAVKIFVSLLANLLAALTFILLELFHPTGALVFRAAAPLAVGSVLGGYFGFRVVRRLPPSALRSFAAAVGVAIAVYLIVR